MHFFKGDLFRFFMVGFALGALGLALTMGGEADADGLGMVPHALAAPVSSN
ncbi:MAG TPA: hypothetical protein VI199_13935 [Novosphingobium sp.]